MNTLLGVLLLTLAVLAFRHAGSRDTGDGELALSVLCGMLAGGLGVLFFMSGIMPLAEQMR